VTDRRRDEVHHGSEIGAGLDWIGGSVQRMDASTMITVDQLRVAVGLLLEAS